MTRFAGWLLAERDNGLQKLRLTDARTGKPHHLPFPEPVYSAFVSVNREYDTKLLRYAYNSVTTPASTYDYDVAARKSVLLKHIIGLLFPDHGEVVVQGRELSELTRSQLLALQPFLTGRWFATRRVQAIRAIEKAHGSRVITTGGSYPLVNFRSSRSAAVPSRRPW